MQFVLMIFQGTTPLPGSPEWEALSQKEETDVYADYAALNKTPGVSNGLPLGLPENARTVQVRDGETVVADGTFIDNKEPVGGYVVFEADDMNAAIELAARIPAARLGGAIEIRPAETYW